MGNGKSKSGKLNFGGGVGQISTQELDSLAQVIENEIQD